MMLIELLTPLMLATAPTTFTMPESLTYSHSVQSQVGDNGETSFTTFTSGGTQTFGYNGKPMDSDNDTDQS
jgi:hypothetical protein